MTDFKVGDVVKIIIDSAWDLSGQIGVISEICSKYALPYTVTIYNGQAWGFKAEELALIDDRIGIIINIYTGGYEYQVDFNYNIGILYGNELEMVYAEV